MLSVKKIYTNLFQNLILSSATPRKKLPLQLGYRHWTASEYPLEFLSRHYASRTKSPRQVTVKEIPNLPLEEPKLTSVDTAHDYDSIKTQYPEPKGTLHNFYQSLRSQIKANNTSLPTATYRSSQSKKGKHTWTCSYKFTWPQEQKIEASAATKQEASKKAALNAILWLKNLGKITSAGQPVLFDKSDIKKLKQPVFIDIGDEVLGSLNNILNTYHACVDEVDELTSTANVATEKYHDEREERVVFRNYDRIKRDLSSRDVELSYSLPIDEYRDKLLDLINNNQVTILKGEPGCGKSTRIGQFLIDDFLSNDRNKCNVIISEPRRIAAISLAETVSRDRGEQMGSTIGYHVRLQSNYNPSKSLVLYCTSGILLKRLQIDPELKDVSHVVLDEAHERDVNTDILLVLLRNAINSNPQLKVIISSATIDVRLFQEFFGNAPVCHVAGRVFPVKKMFLDDFHGNMPSLRKTYGTSFQDNPMVHPDEVAELIKWIDARKGPGAILCFLPGWDEIRRVKNALDYHYRGSRNHLVLPLHSRLTNADQYLIFERPNEGVRKIILSTNIAETSVTIGDVVYVVDTGTQNEHRLDPNTGMECFGHFWIAKSNVEQRKGRAGRVQAGESFHLFTKDRFDKMDLYSIPEVQRISLTKLVLDTKVFNDQMKALDFLKLLPDAPEEIAIQKAVNELISLNILSNDERLTSLGHIVSLFALPPKLSKALVYSYLFKCVTPITNIVTIFGANTEIFSRDLDTERSVLRELKKEWCETSDHLSLNYVFDEWNKKDFRKVTPEVREWCRDLYLNPFKLMNISRLRNIHLDYINDLKVHDLPLSDQYSQNEELVKAVLLAATNNVLQPRSYEYKKGAYKKSEGFITEGHQSALVTQDSVNYKRRQDGNYLMYINEVHSMIRRQTIIRETSLMSPVAMLLFKSCKFEIERVLPSHDGSEEKCVVKIGNNFKVTCLRTHAEKIIEVKDAINSMIEHILSNIHGNGRLELTNDVVFSSWSRILEELDKLLSSTKINDGF